MEKKDTTSIRKIISHYLSNHYSPATEEKVQQWLLSNRYALEKEESSLIFWNKLKVKTDPATYRSLLRVKAKANIPAHFGKKILLPAWARVAAVLLPLIIAGIFYYIQNVSGKISEIYVPYGAKKQITLPDGSQVILNSGTTFRYPEKFSGEKREVVLSGEALFMVTKNAAKPFLVKTGHLIVKVLGTQFNVKAYINDSQTTTTLLSGKVEVKTNAQKSFILNPNQQLSFNNNTSSVKIGSIAAVDETNWINGQMIFTVVSFQDILHSLERRFNVTIKTAGPAIVSPEELYTVKFLRNESLEQILDVLKEVVGDFSYQKTDSKIILTKK